MDSSHVSLVSLILRPEGFDKYRCDRDISMGVNISNMSSIFKYTNINDVLTMQSKDKPDYVIFKFENQSKDKVSDYCMKLMNIDQEHLEIPETDYDCVIKMPSMEFAKICRDLSQFGESITICCTKDGVRFSASGDVGVANVNLAQTYKVDKEEEAVTIDLQAAVSLTFATRYLTHFIKATPLSAQVQLSISKEVPLIVEYPIEDFGFIRYYLAPKIEDEK